MFHVATLQLLEQLRTPLLNELMVSITALGSAVVVAIVIYTLYRFDRIDTAVLALVASAAAGVAVKVLKPVVGRPRPDAVSAVLEGGLQSAAFPSGHTTLAFALAATLEMELDAGGYFYVLAALVGISRLYLGVHYPGDVLAGALLGLAAGYAVYRYRDRVLTLINPAF